MSYKNLERREKHVTKISRFGIIKTMENQTKNNVVTDEEAKKYLVGEYANLSMDQLAEKAIDKAIQQLITSTDFKKPRLAKIEKYYNLYNGKTTKKLRQLFNVPLPVFAGMIDTLNAQYDTPIQIKFKEGDASDYFKVQKINGAFQMETMNTAENSKWDSKLRISRKDAIFTGRGIVRYEVSSDPEYKSNLENVSLKDFHFQPRGGSSLEKHLWAGQEGFQKTKSDILRGVRTGLYNQKQAVKLLETASKSEYFPEYNGTDMTPKLERFKPLDLSPDQHNYVGEPIYKLAEWILHMDGERYYIEFDPWTRTWVRFEKWKDICSSGLYPWDTWATHEDPENFLSKSYGDDLYVACDAVVGLFNQELTNREKRNFGARAYDKEMFTDVRKLDEAMYRPDALVPANVPTGKRLSEGVYEFKVGELGGTVNLIDWITGSLGRNTGANDLNMGEVQNVSKKASVTFAEQKSISKRLSWASASFQEMMASLAKKYIWGLKDHMPSKMAIRLLGQNGEDWDQITRLDLDTTKDVDIIILSSDKQFVDNEAKSKKRMDVLGAIANDKNLASIANPQWRLEQLLRTAEFDDVEIAVAMDSKSYADKKALAKSAEAIQLILQGKEPLLWFGATISFMQKIVDYASDNRSTLGDKYQKLIEYSNKHYEIVKQNLERRVKEEQMIASSMQLNNPVTGESKPTAENPGMPGGMSKALSMANQGME